MSNMNTEELNAIWQIMLKTIRADKLISEAASELWFKRFRLDDLDARRAVFAAENEMKANIIREKYGSMLAAQIEKVIGYAPDIEVIVDPTLAPKLTKPAAGESADSPSSGKSWQSLVTQFGGDPLAFARGTAAQAADADTEKTDREYDAPDTEYTDPDADDDTDAATDAQNQKKDRPIVSPDGTFHFNPTYTFENFVVGESNHFAQAAALSVAENIGTKYNPLFIYGPSGLGKTHLMYAIANRAIKRDPSMKIVYVKGEEFMNQLIEAIRAHTNAAFREKYRSADMLLIDDIQFIAGKDSTQMEFFHTFDALHECNKQIIITSDRPPKELTTLEERIRTRFEAGLITDIQPPDLELRLAILKNKASQNNLDIPMDVIDFLADNLQSNIRQIEGAIKKLGAKNLLSGMPITMDMVITTLPDYLRDAEPVEDTVTRIVETVAKRYNVTAADIKGSSRKKDIQTARNVSMYIVRTITNLSLSQIGTAFSRDHSTIHSNITMVEGKLATDTVFEATVNELIKDIKHGAN